MKILLSCSGGMSSSLIADGLQKEGQKRQEKITVQAVGTEEVADLLGNDQFDIVLLAPQSVYRKDYIQEQAQDHDTPFLMIPRTMYNPVAVPKLLDLVQQELNK
ncbi:PTS fructose transporter subunit IIA [Bombilactobacillus folatiphilus]|uniref:PTS fructose transporter subunit IIA n=1 Tax=Bombilactobacillus folatiphilus TaxID=2923362 RepID=A0ABY4P7A1_9LACO|nr:PTS fructose transporter subunit IIA [Bombilactobacillus folatiphilus]UQS81460.1 PTS fructose transporter subunit IIA [Bombilactobacillus folatiphilus]